MKILSKILKYFFLFLISIISLIFIWILLPINENKIDVNIRDNTKYWNLNTGSEIAYQFIKSKTDTVKSTIIYLHGGPGGYIDNKTVSVYNKISEAGFNVFLYDQIGCGFSERLENPQEYTVQRHINDLNEIIELLNTEKIVLVGQSWGGFLATYYTSIYSDKIDKFILTSPKGIIPVDSIIYQKYVVGLVEGLSNIDERIKKINEKISSDLTLKEKIWLGLAKKTKSKFLVSDSKVDGVLNKVFEILMKVLVCDTTHVQEPSGIPGMYCSIFTNESYKDIPKDIRNNIKKISKPALILKGECDYIDWQQTFEYYDLLPNSELKIIENSGHSIYTENTEEYMSSILYFLNNENIQPKKN